MWKSKKTDRNPGLCGHYQSELDNSLIPRGGKITFPLPRGLSMRSKNIGQGAEWLGACSKINIVGWQWATCSWDGLIINFASSMWQSCDMLPSVTAYTRFTIWTLIGQYINCAHVIQLADMHPIKEFWQGQYRIVMMTLFHSSILCMYILHTRDTVCDDHPSSSTTGHDFAKSSRRAHSGLFIVDINGVTPIYIVLCGWTCRQLLNKIMIFCRVYSEREGCYHPSSCFPAHCTQTVDNFMSRNWI